jgi:uncharacterized protein DUF6455
MKSAKSGPRSDLADFHQTVLMDDMMRVVGVDVLDVIDVDGGRSYVRARSCCRRCTRQTECRDWLVQHSQGEPQDFCVNANLFRSVKGGKA